MVHNYRKDLSSAFIAYDSQIFAVYGRNYFTPLLDMMRTHPAVEQINVLTHPLLFEPFIYVERVLRVLKTPIPLRTVPAGQFRKKKSLRTKVSDPHLRTRAEFMNGSLVVDPRNFRAHSLAKHHVVQH